MKTKEFDVWVDKDDFGYGIDYGMWKLKKTVNCTLKAKLIVQIPEKKIEITESEFDKAIMNNFQIQSLNRNWCDMKKELGFTDEV